MHNTQNNNTQNKNGGGTDFNLDPKKLKEILLSGWHESESKENGYHEFSKDTTVDTFLNQCFNNRLPLAMDLKKGFDFRGIEKFALPQTKSHGWMVVKYGDLLVIARNCGDASYQAFYYAIDKKGQARFVLEDSADRNSKQEPVLFSTWEIARQYEDVTVNVGYLLEGKTNQEKLQKELEKQKIESKRNLLLKLANGIGRVETEEVLDIRSKMESIDKTQQVQQNIQQQNQQQNQQNQNQPQQVVNQQKITTLLKDKISLNDISFNPNLAEWELKRREDFQDEKSQYKEMSTKFDFFMQRPICAFTLTGNLFKENPDGIRFGRNSGDNKSNTISYSGTSICNIINNKCVFSRKTENGNNKYYIKLVDDKVIDSLKGIEVELPIDDMKKSGQPKYLCLGDAKFNVLKISAEDNGDIRCVALRGPEKFDQPKHIESNIGKIIKLYKDEMSVKLLLNNKVQLDNKFSQEDRIEFYKQLYQYDEKKVKEGQWHASQSGLINDLVLEEEDKNIDDAVEKLVLENPTLVEKNDDEMKSKINEYLKSQESVWGDKISQHKLLMEKISDLIVTQWGARLSLSKTYNKSELTKKINHTFSFADKGTNDTNQIKQPLSRTFSFADKGNDTNQDTQQSQNSQLQIPSKQQQQLQIPTQKDQNLSDAETKIRQIIKSKPTLSQKPIVVTITKDGSDRVIISISGITSGQVKFKELLKGKKELYNKLSNAKSGTKSISIETKNLREIVDLLEKNARTQWGDKHLKNKTQQFQKY